MRLTVIMNRFTSLEFNALLPDVVTIADKEDARLKEQMMRFMGGCRQAGD